MGLLSAVLLIVCAPIIPLILGADYANSVAAIRWLSPLCLIKAIHYFAADTLTGAGHQKLRSLVQVLVAIFNVGINFWLIPKYSWQGAAASSLMSDLLLLLSLWGFVFFVRARSKKQQPSGLPEPYQEK